MAKITTTPRKPRGPKPSHPPTGLAARLKSLRQQAGVSQKALGAQGFVSAPGWIKIENGQRSPSEELLSAFVGWLIEQKAVPAGAKAALVEELMAHKYSEHPRAVPFPARQGTSGRPVVGRPLMDALRRRIDLETM